MQLDGDISIWMFSVSHWIYITIKVPVHAFSYLHICRKHVCSAKPRNSEKMKPKIHKALLKTVHFCPLLYEKLIKYVGFLHLLQNTFIPFIWNQFSFSLSFSFFPTFSDWDSTVARQFIEKQSFSKMKILNKEIKLRFQHVFQMLTLFVPLL